MIFIVGINKEEKKTTYNILVASKGKYEIAEVPEYALIYKFTKGLKVENAKLKNNTIVGSTGSLERFKPVNGHRPLVIISKIVDNKDNILGYRLSDYKGVVKAIKLTDLIAFASKAKERGLVAIQNGVYVEKTSTVKAHIKSYNADGFAKELIPTKNAESKYKHKVKVDYNENRNNIQRISEIFNRDQIEQLKLGKAHGINIALYASKKFSAEQMRQIREGLEHKVRAKLYADPKFSAVQMSRLKSDMISGIDVADYANPIYSNGQMTQLKLGKIAGVDISLFANPNTSVQEMTEIRTRLELGIWCDCAASKIDVSKLEI